MANAIYDAERYDAERRYEMEREELDFEWRRRQMEEEFYRRPMMTLRCGWPTREELACKEQQLKAIAKQAEEMKRLKREIKKRNGMLLLLET